MDNTESNFEGQPFASRRGEVRSEGSPAKGTSWFVRVFGVVAWLSWCSQQRLNERARVVLLVLGDLHCRHGSVFPSLRYLAELVGCSPSSVRTALRELEQAGIIRCISRYEHKPFTGGRQTSNRYELVRLPTPLPKPEPVTVVEDDGSELVGVEVTCDDFDPNQLELDDHVAAQTEPPTGSQDASEPSDSTPSSTTHEEGRAAQRGATAVQAPFKPATPPLQTLEGIEELKENSKANSTRAGDSQPAPLPAHDPATPPPSVAAASPGDVLTTERGRALKRRFGLETYSTLFFALRASPYREHPRLAGQVIDRLLEAGEVRNPGGWFRSVFAAELEAQRLTGTLSTEDVQLETERTELAQLTERKRHLEAQLERVQGRDFDRADQIRAELEDVNSARKRLARQDCCSSSSIPAVATTPALTPQSPEETIRQAQQVLARLKGRAAA